MLKKVILMATLCCFGPAFKEAAAVQELAQLELQLFQAQNQLLQVQNQLEPLRLHGQPLPPILAMREQQLIQEILQLAFQLDPPPPQPPELRRH